MHMLAKVSIFHQNNCYNTYIYIYLYLYIYTVHHRTFGHYISPPVGKAFPRAGHDVAVWQRRQGPRGALGGTRVCEAKGILG